MAYSERTLANISGKSALDTTTQLLDNTLATIENGVRLKNQAQMHQLRNLEIKQTMAEMAEWEKDAYNRGLQRELMRKKGENDIANFEQVAAMQLETTRNDFVASESAAIQNIYDMLLASDSDDAKNTVLEQYGEHLPASVYESVKNSNFDDASQKEAWVNEAHRTMEFERAKRLQQIKNAGSASSGTIKAKGSAENIAVALQNNLDISDAGVAMDLGERSIQMMENLKNWGIPAPPSSISTYMVGLTEKYPERYWENPDAWKWNPFSSKGRLNTELLFRDAEASIRANGGVPYIHPENENKPEPWERLDMEPAEWNLLRSQYPESQVSDDEIIKQYLEHNQ